MSNARLRNDVSPEVFHAARLKDYQRGIQGVVSSAFFAGKSGGLTGTGVPGTPLRSVFSRSLGCSNLPSSLTGEEAKRIGVTLDDTRKDSAMCLGIPGQVKEIYEMNGIRMGKVDFNGIVKDVCLAYLPDINVGDYTIVHVGFAITRLDEQSALETLALFENLGVLDEELRTDSAEEEAA